MAMTVVCFGSFCLAEDLIFGLCICDADQMVPSSEFQPIGNLSPSLLAEVRSGVQGHPFRQMLSDRAQKELGLTVDSSASTALEMEVAR